MMPCVSVLAGEKPPSTRGKANSVENGDCFCALFPCIAVYVMIKKGAALQGVLSTLFLYLACACLAESSDVLIDTLHKDNRQAPRPIGEENEAVHKYQLAAEASYLGGDKHCASALKRENRFVEHQRVH